MKRFTTDNPQTNVERMLNYAYVKDRDVILRYADGKNDIDLCEYMAEKAKEEWCHNFPGDIRDGACFELGCECDLTPLYVAATQAAELRERLKAYEDTGLEPEEVMQMKAEFEQRYEAEVHVEEMKGARE